MDNIEDVRFKLPSGRVSVLCASRTSAVRTVGNETDTERFGKHLLFHIEGDPERKDVSEEDSAAFYGQAYLLAQKLSESKGFTPGYFRIEINGPKTASYAHHHAHIIVLNEDELVRANLTVRRCVDPVLTEKKPK